MRLFDTHCHIADPAFDEDRADVLARLRAAGVVRANVVADPCEDEPNQVKVFDLVHAEEGLCASIGVHPHNARRYDDDIEKTLLEYLADPACRLLGEIGLDYHYDLSPHDVQREVFDRQLELAYQKGYAVQLHIREAHGDCTDMLRTRVRAGRMPRGIMHCYTGSRESAEFYLDAGLYISFSGALTFRNAPKLQEVCRFMPEDRMLIETDCPYMAPVPLRGRRNEPAFIVHTLEKLAEVRGTAVEDAAETLYRNALTAFGFDEVRT